MLDSFLTSEKKGCLYAVSSEREEILAKLALERWETDFFKRKFGAVSIDHELLGSYSQTAIEDIFDAIFQYADKKQYELLELRLDTSGIRLVPTLEDKGFRLVDSRMSFMTLMAKPEIEEVPLEEGELCFAEERDLQGIMDLTRRVFSGDPSFLSRFTNHMYFTPAETERYYSAWVRNHLEGLDTYFALLKEKGIIIGYLIYKKTGSLKGKPIYKGILVAVDPDHRGHRAHLAMQPFVYKHIPEDQFYLDTVTQLTNVPAIRNYIKSKKNLNRIELIFFRQRGK